MYSDKKQHLSRLDLNMKGHKPMINTARPIFSSFHTILTISTIFSYPMLSESTIGYYL